MDPAEPSTHWEAAPQLSAAEVDAVVVLAVLTFALQLCLVLYFLFRCWRLNIKAQEALKQNSQTPHVTDQLLHCESSTSVKSSESHNLYYEPMDGTCAYKEPSIPWDLVQH